jgi:hypothetical protein
VSEHLSSDQEAMAVLRLLKRTAELRHIVLSDRGGPGCKPASGEFYCFPRWMMREIDEALGIPPSQMSADGGKDIPL